MKKMLSVLLALALMASTATVAFAAGGVKNPKEGEYFSGVASFDNPEVFPGETVYLDVDYFYGKWTEREREWDDDKDRDVTVKTTYDNEDYPLGGLDKEYHTVKANWTSGGQYIENVYFEDGDSYITIEIKGGINLTVDKDIKGTIKILEKNIPNRPSVTYECKIKSGALVLQAVDEKAQMVEYGDRKFYLPDDYQEKQVRFRTDDGENYGTFLGEFDSQKDGKPLAEFQVRIYSQSALFLGFSESPNTTLENKYPNAKMRYINWTSRPTFDREGKLSIFMDPNDYIYGVNNDDTLYRLGGTYDSANKAYVITTKTLGSYVISDTQLVVGGSGGTTTTTPSSSSAPSSSTAPSSTAPPASTAQPSSTAPAPTSPSSSSGEEQASEPESSEPEESSIAAPAISQPDDDDADNGGREPVEKKDFPLIPVLLGVLGVAIVIFGVVVVASRGKGAHTRRRRYDEDWDE